MKTKTIIYAISIGTISVGVIVPIGIFVANKIKNNSFKSKWKNIGDNDGYYIRQIDGIKGDGTEEFDEIKKNKFFDSNKKYKINGIDNIQIAFKKNSGNYNYDKGTFEYIAILKLENEIKEIKVAYVKKYSFITYLHKKFQKFIKITLKENNYDLIKSEDGIYNQTKKFTTDDFKNRIESRFQINRFQDLSYVKDNQTYDVQAKILNFIDPKNDKIGYNILIKKYNIESKYEILYNISDFAKSEYEKNFYEFAYEKEGETLGNNIIAALKLDKSKKPSEEKIKIVNANDNLLISLMIKNKKEEFKISKINENDVEVSLEKGTIKLKKLIFKSVSNDQEFQLDNFLISGFKTKGKEKFDNMKKKIEDSLDKDYLAEIIRVLGIDLRVRYDNPKNEQGNDKRRKIDIKEEVSLNELKKRELIFGLDHFYYNNIKNWQNKNDFLSFNMSIYYKFDKKTSSQDVNVKIPSSWFDKNLKSLQDLENNIYMKYMFFKNNQKIDSNMNKDAYNKIKVARSRKQHVQFWIQGLKANFWYDGEKSIEKKENILTLKMNIAFDEEENGNKIMKNLRFVFEK